MGQASDIVVPKLPCADAVGYLAVYRICFVVAGTSKPLFPPSRLSVHGSVRSSITLQRYITLIAPEAPSALSRALPNLEFIRAADNFLIISKEKEFEFPAKTILTILPQSNT